MINNQIIKSKFNSRRVLPRLFLPTSVFLASALALCFAFSVPTFAQDLPTSVTIKPSLGLSLSSSSVMLSLDPTTTPFASETIDVVVGTNNPTGYWLTMSSNNDDTSLVNINDTTKTIPTLESDTLEANFPVNHWGYKISSNNAGNDNANYLPYISGTTIASNNSKVNNDTTNLTIASKVDYLSVPGIYKQTFNFTALPHITNYYMQDFSNPAIAQEVCKSDGPSIVIDKRDEQTYQIRRIGDNCWMVENLRFGYNLSNPDTTIITLSPEDSNVTEERAITAYDMAKYGNTNCSSSNNQGYIYPCMHTKDDTSGDGTIGLWYNYAMATAGTIVGSSNITKAGESICPASWRLPTNVEQNSLIDHPAEYNISLGGYYGNGAINSIRNGYWWSSVAPDEGQSTLHDRYTDRFYLAYNSSFYQMSNTRHLGFFVRCIHQEY